MLCCLMMKFPNVVLPFKATCCPTSGVENNQQVITMTGRISPKNNDYSPTLPIEKVISVYEASQHGTII